MLESPDLSIWHIAGALVAAATAVVALFTRLRNAFWVVAAMFFAASIGVTDTPSGIPIKLWIWPLTFNRSKLFALCGALLLLAVFAHGRQVTMERRPLQGLALLAIGIYAGLLRIAHDGAIPGTESILFALVTIGPLLYILPGLLKEWSDFSRMLRAIGWANVVWIVCVAVQFLVNATLLTKGKEGRFFGLTGQTQIAAAYLAIMGTLTLWLFLNDSKRGLRWVWLVIFSLDIVMVVWTGSRTGFGMLIIGLTAVLFSRFGRAVLLLPIAAIVVWGSFHLALALGIDLSMAERLTSTEDTRSRTWLTLLDIGMDAPLFGVGIVDAAESENSYLQAFAAYGFGMVFLVALLVGVSVVVVLELLHLRRWSLPTERALIDLLIGYNVMYFGAAMVEGIIMARVGAPLMFMVIASAMATQLRSYMNQQAALGESGSGELDTEGEPGQHLESGDEQAFGYHDDAYEAYPEGSP